MNSKKILHKLATQNDQSKRLHKIAQQGEDRWKDRWKELFKNYPDEELARLKTGEENLKKLKEWYLANKGKITASQYGVGVGTGALGGAGLGYATGMDPLWSALGGGAAGAGIVALANYFAGKSFPALNAAASELYGAAEDERQIRRLDSANVLIH